MRSISFVMLAMVLAVGCGDDPPVTDHDSGTTPDAGGDTDAGHDHDDDAGHDHDAGTAPTLDCETYCEAVQASCTGANAQYSSLENCMDVCSSLDEGALGETTGNTLGCRLYHVGAAATDPDVHCLHAGPTGGTEAECGGSCESFCTIALDQCDGVYTDAAACATACAAFDTDPAYSTAASGGDSFACRMYHLTVAATSPDPHCEHIRPVSDTCRLVP